MNDTHFRNVLMLGELLGWIVTGKDYKEEIRLGATTWGYNTTGFNSSLARSYDISTMYESDNTWKASTILNEINNNGTYLINHLGHGNTGTLMKLNSNYVDDFNNTGYFFVFSQACYSGAIDTDDCIAEKMLNNRYGAFSLITNSRYVWGDYSSSNGPS